MTSLTLVNVNLNAPVKSIMTEKLVKVEPNAIVSRIADLFEKNNLHHLPVINEDGVAVGIISKNDYHKLQHHFTIFNFDEAKDYNKKFFDTLIAEEIMVKKPITIGPGTTIEQALKMFLTNKFHCLLVVDHEKCVGIITPFDFLEMLIEQGK